MTPRELQALSNLGNESEAAADEIAELLALLAAARRRMHISQEPGLATDWRAANARFNALCDEIEAKLKESK